MALFGLTIVVGCERKQMLFVITRMDKMERGMTTQSCSLNTEIKRGFQQECSSKSWSHDHGSLRRYIYNGNTKNPRTYGDNGKRLNFRFEHPSKGPKVSIPVKSGMLFPNCGVKRTKFNGCVYSTGFSAAFMISMDGGFNHSKICTFIYSYTYIYLYIPIHTYFSVQYAFSFHC